MTLTVAGLQHAGVAGDVEANLAIIETAAREAVDRGATMLVTPEMFVTGYNIDGSLEELAAQDLPSRVARIARQVGISIVAGLPLPVETSPETRPGTSAAASTGQPRGIHNSLVVIDAHGTELTRYNKTHLFGELDRGLFVAGEALPEPIEVDGVRLGFLICYDVEFPETVRAAALAGVDAVIVPTAQMEPFAHIAERLIPVRAWENQVHIAYVNRTGFEGELRYVGRSSIVGPDGERLAALGGLDAGLLVATIDPDATTRARRANPYLDDRRPDLY
ncbi:carbon-nitrogen hydrolase family protein [Agreia sp. COWG]|uniref:carbon-nitrogen hydrolase family protein n=1 Tax=Agreia sp. COWG TaxID=2773266 RepID=UPI001928E028|nr:carbon-nitrogen hydrolase family protein [Agreia sp. COWG]CAD6008807.1 Hydrolase in pqqF 5'region [Agreia sp. COWG]